MSSVEFTTSDGPPLLDELRKLPAFLRRDFLVAWSYRMAFVSDAVALLTGAIAFYFIGLMVDPAVLPTYGGSRATYMEFAAVGIALGVFIQLGLGRVASALRSEQLWGTLESLLMTPTSATTIQLGSVVYELIYIPIRTAIFFAIIAVTFGLDLEPSGMLPAAVLLLVFIPFVWGLGLASAASMLTFRYGSSGLGLAVGLLTLFGGAYFPLDLLPDWASTAAEANPIAIVIEGMRESLLGGLDWAETARALLTLLPFALVSLAAGAVAFRLALRRERRLGTIGLY
jgi:ABC-2 type transport system permease protein